MKKDLIWTFLLVVGCLVFLTACIDDEGFSEGTQTVAASEDGSADTVDTNGFTSLIVKYRKERAVTREMISERLSRFGQVRFRKWRRANDTSGDDFSVVSFDRSKHNWRQLRSRILADDDIEYVEPNYIMRAFATPNDPYYEYQWNMQMLDMPAAWDITMGRAEVVVAVIDSGVAYNLDDLAGTRFDLQNDWDFVENDNDAYDQNSHGTHVVGTIAQTTNNNNGTAGMAPGVTILPVRALGANGIGYLADIADGITYAADHGAHIINLSVGGGFQGYTMKNALRYAYQKGVTIFAATGNSGAGTISYPAAYDDYVIAVGAVGVNKQRVRYSQYGNSLDVVAPGGDLSVDRNRDGFIDGILQQTITGYRWFRTDYTPTYAFYEGTSMACPHAAALGALLKSHNFSATADQIREAIQNTATDVGDSGWDRQHGYGLINPVAALRAIGGDGSGSEDTCRQWTATNAMHVASGRAYTQQQASGCYYLVNYYTVGSDDNLGTSGSTTTTLYSDDGGQTYGVGQCP